MEYSKEEFAGLRSQLNSETSALKSQIDALQEQTAEASSNQKSSFRDSMAEEETEQDPMETLRRTGVALKIATKLARKS